MNKPTILIIAGGNNSRFAPLNTKTHKGFLSLLGKPIVDRALENLKKHGFKKVVIVVSDKDYRDTEFSNYLSNNSFGLDIQIVLQKEAKGMGNAVLLAKKYLDDSFILASPYYPNLGQKAEMLWTKKQENHADCVFSGTLTNTPELYGILNLDPNNQEKVLGITEKSERDIDSSSFKIDSVYLFDNGFINELENTSESEYALEKAMTTYALKVEISWIQNTQKIKSIKYPWHLFNSFNQIISEEKTFVSSSAKLSKTAIFDDSNGPIIVDDGARIGDFVKIVGPCYVGKDCLVGDYSFVRGSSLETGVTVGANTEVVRSILFENSSIHYGYLADSILGHNTKIGAGLITANKRLDRKNIRVLVKGKLIDTGTNTLGIITGEKTNIGIRVNTMPGITIGANAQIHPNATVSRNVAAKTTLEK